MRATDPPQSAENITGLFAANRPAGAPWAVAIEPEAAHTAVGIQQLLPWMKTIADLRLPPDAAAGQPIVLLVWTRHPPHGGHGSALRLY